LGDTHGVPTVRVKRSPHGDAINGSAGSTEIDWPTFNYTRAAKTLPCREAGREPADLSLAICRLMRAFYPGREIRQTASADSREAEPGRTGPAPAAEA